MGVDGSPLNILLPIPAPRRRTNKLMSPADAAKAFANTPSGEPENHDKIPAGRETTYEDFQGLLMLSA